MISILNKYFQEIRYFFAQKDNKAKSKRLFPLYQYLNKREPWSELIYFFMQKSILNKQLVFKQIAIDLFRFLKFQNQDISDDELLTLMILELALEPMITKLRRNIRGHMIRM